MKKNIWGKIGWFCVAQSIGVMSLCMQLCCGVALMMIFAVEIIIKYDGTRMMPNDQLILLIQERYLANAMIGVALYHVVGILVFGLWYYFAYGRKKRPATAEKPGVKGVVAVVVMGLLLQVFISGFLGILMETFPQLFESYLELMETAGITETTFLAVFTTVVMAPIGEELLCRGIIMRMAEKVSVKFWAVNCIQALAFGIIHGNLVQGIYAFFLGLVLGYIYKKYHNIWMCMLLHAVINLASNFVDGFFEAVCGKELLPVGIICVVTAVLLAICFKLIGKIKPLEEVKVAEMIPE